jgi:hypothetical protein
VQRLGAAGSASCLQCCPAGPSDPGGCLTPGPHGEGHQQLPAPAHQVTADTSTGQATSLVGRPPYIYCAVGEAEYKVNIWCQHCLELQVYKQLVAGCIPLLA